MLTKLKMENVKAEKMKTQDGL